MKSKGCLLLLFTVTDDEHNPYAYFKALRVYKDLKQFRGNQVVHFNLSVMHI